MLAAILGNSWMNYFTEFDVYIMYVFIFYLFCTKIVYF